MIPLSNIVIIFSIQLEDFKKNLSKISEECYILSKIPEKLDKSIRAIAPKVAEEIQSHKQLKIDEMTIAINSCSQNFNKIKDNIESLRINCSKNFFLW